MATMEGPSAERGAHNKVQPERVVIVPFDDLQGFLYRLEAAGELKRVGTMCDPVLEIPEIAGRVVREDGPALLFERVKGSPYPLAINVLASERRIELALGRHPQKIGEDLLDVAEQVSRPTPRRLWSQRARLWSLRSMRTTTARRGRSQEVDERPNLASLPVLHCWPADGGRFITLPMVLTADPHSGRRNLGTYRMQVFDEATTGMHWQIQKGGRYHHDAAELAGQPLNVTVAIGADPALVLASVSPLPENVDELTFAGLLRGRPTRLAPARTFSGVVPADAEFVLEGTVAPGERRLEGPFGDHFGHYSLAAPFPVFRVKRVTRRKNPVYLASVVGKPPQEDRCLGDAVQQITAPLIRLIQPEIRSLWSYAASGFHNLLVVSTRVRYPREGIKSALSLLGQGQTALTKCLVVVDDDVDPRDFGAVLRAIRANFDPRRDLTLIEEAPLDTLDFTSFRQHVGSKMIVSATRELERAPRAQQGETQHVSPADLLRRLRDRGIDVSGARLVEGALLVAVVEKRWDATAGADAPARATLRGVMAEAGSLGAPLAALVSPDVRLDDPDQLIWGIFTRFDPGRDVVRPGERFGAGCVESGDAPASALGIDATWKEGYPAPVEMSEEIVALVSRRWTEYGL